MNHSNEGRGDDSSTLRCSITVLFHFAVRIQLHVNWVQGTRTFGLILIKDQYSHQAVSQDARHAQRLD